MPAVSVVLPTYNRAWSLKRAIRSVLAQTYADFELIVVDDASTDDTPALLQTLDDPRLRYIRLPQNGGVSIARNRGIEEAKAELVAFQDSDDEWRVEKLERLVRSIEGRPDVGLTSCGDICVNATEISFLGLDADEPVLDITRMVNLRLPGASRWLARRQLLRDLGGFDPELNCFEDWELALRISERSRVLFVNEPLHLYNKTPGSLFAAEHGYARNLTHIVDRHRRRLEADPRAWAFCCNLIGQSECQYGSASEGRRWFFQALRAAPGSVRAWLNVAMSFSGAAAFRAYVRFARTVRARIAPATRPQHHGG